MRKSIAATVCLALFAGTAQGSGTFETNRANVWVFDNSPGGVRDFAVKDWTTGVSFQPGDPAADVHREEGLSAPLTIAGTVDMILVNNSATSWPAASSSTAPFAISGLSVGSTNTGDGNAVPSVSILPADGTYGETVEVVLRVEPISDNGSPVSVQWQVSGTQDSPAEGTFNTTVSGPSWQTSFFLVAADQYGIQAEASQDGKTSPSVSASITIDASVDPRRDTDGDGIPDSVEVALGANPLDVDGNRDSDNDGWTDLQEALRCEDVDPFSCQAGEPLDRDLDGWSDADEIWRGTDPDDPTGVDGDGKTVPAEWPDRPTARRLTEVEYRLPPTPVYQDGGGTPMMPLSFGSVAGLAGNGLYDSRELPTEAELADQPADQTMTALPVRLQREEALRELESGYLPAMRVPASELLVLRAENRNNKGAPGGAVQKRLLAGQDDLTAPAVNDILYEKGTWSSPLEWLEAYRDVLRQRLVQDRNGLTLEPVESIQADFIAGQLSRLDATREWQPGLAAPDLPSAPVRRWQRLLDARGTDALAMTASIRESAFTPLGDLADELQSIHTGPFDGESVVRRIIERGQQQLSDTEAYLLSLYLMLTPAEIEAIASLSDPSADSDSDGLVNLEELRGLVWTRPDRADSDGDGVEDGSDPCPTDRGNACLGDGRIDDDRDGDTVPDSLDNCPDMANPLQRDSDDFDGSGSPDGVGDECGEEIPVVISNPRANLRITAGTSVTFAATLTEAARDGAGLEWDFDGLAPASSSLTPPPVTFSQTGVYTIRLLSSAGEQNFEQRRMVEVLGSAGDLVPSVSLADLTIREPDSSSVFLAFDPQLSAASEKEVTLDWSLRSGSADAGAGADFVADRGTLRFASGETSATGLVEVMSDGIVEGEEDFEIVLERANNALLQTTAARVVITEDATASPATVSAMTVTSSVVTEDDRYTVQVDAVTVLNVLANDQAQGGSPVIVSVPRNGSARVETDGTVHYRPADGFSGVDAFEYAVDGVSARVELFVTAGYVLHNDDDGVWMRELGGQRQDTRLTDAAVAELDRHARLSPDGRHLVVFDQGALRLYGPGSLRDRQNLETGLSGTVAAFSPSGRYLAWQAGDGTVFRLDLHRYQAPVALSVVNEPLQALAWVGGSLTGVACDRLYRPAQSATPVLDGGRACSLSAPDGLGEPRLFALSGMPVWWLDGRLLTDDGTDVVAATPETLVVDKGDGAIGVDARRLLFIAEADGIAGLFALSDSGTVSRLSGADRRVEAFAFAGDGRVAYIDGAQTDALLAPGATTPIVEAARLHSPSAADAGWTLVKEDSNGARVARVDSSGDTTVVGGDNATTIVDYRQTGAGLLLLSGAAPHSLRLEHGDGSVSILDDRVGITDSLRVFLP